MSELINRGDERVARFIASIDRLTIKADSFFTSFSPSLNGERFMTDKQVSERLHVSRRTLQDYRNEGKIAYFMLGGKCLYKESDIQTLLENHYIKSWQ